MLNLKDAARWPLRVRLACAALLAVLTAVLAHVVWLDGLRQEWQAAQQEETRLRAAHQLAQARAGQLPALRERQRQAGLVLASMERQLPHQQEMAALLSSINQAGLARGLQFSLFKPGAPVPQAHYVALPIAVQLRGGYHAIGAFTADLAQLPRIVTVHDVALTAGKDGLLTLDAVLHAYRLPDPTELAAQAKMPVTKSAPVSVLALIALRDYGAAGFPDPFGTVLQAPAGAATAGVAAPDMRRAREPLESLALPTMSMVGSVLHDGRLSALVQAGGRVHRVDAGQYLGQDHGVVTAISEQGLRYREVLQDAGGVWRERRGSLDLQVNAVSKPEAQP